MRVGMGQRHFAARGEGRHCKPGWGDKLAGRDDACRGSDDTARKTRCCGKPIRWTGDRGASSPTPQSMEWRTVWGRKG